ncbi:hypothetical protein PINS_up011331 [Pythium insidiosum]|nr:hypothetical protein PINS_up011331 [Pythium insidiosum]
MSVRSPGRRHTLGGGTSPLDRNRFDLRLRVEDLKRSPARPSTASDRPSRERALSSQPIHQRLLADESLEREAASAIHIVQQQVEQQARENKAAVQRICHAITAIDAFMRQLDMKDQELIKATDDELEEEENGTATAGLQDVTKLCELWQQILERRETNELTQRRERHEQRVMQMEDSVGHIQRRVEAMARENGTCVQV